MVRAKFECIKNTGGQIHLRPVHGGSKENDEFFSATPAGQIQLMVLNPPAAAQFIVGKSYFVDFNDADAQAEREKAIMKAAGLAETIAKAAGLEPQAKVPEPPPHSQASRVKQTKGP